jgi:hypothetical protein
MEALSDLCHPVSNQLEESEIKTWSGMLGEFVMYTVI